MAVKHPANMPGEVVGKGGNITYAARELQKYLEVKSIDPTRVLVTTLDSDNRPAQTLLFGVELSVLRGAQSAAGVVSAAGHVHQ